jgi:hypothetical protein
LRDLARAEPWRQSLERSRARRRDPAPSPEPVPEPVPEPRPTPSYLSLCWRTAIDRWPLVIAAIAGVLTFVLLAATRPSLSSGLSDRASFTAPASGVHPPPRTPAVGAPAQRCRPADRSAGYVNPLAGAIVKPKRIDQGVDYEGSGTLAAIGDGTITHIGMSDTGWPGAFIEYRLTDGPEAGCYVYYAEGLTPVTGLTVGVTIGAGEPVATLIPGDPTGIEIGWGSGNGTQTYAAASRQWSALSEQDNIPAVAGRSFSALVAALGGPPGLVEG